MSKELYLEIVVASGKGGVGKSTISSSLAILLKEKGYKIVLADADAEAPNLHLIFNISKWDEESDYHEGRIAYIRQDKCINCGICYNRCVFGAIEFSEGIYRVNPWICEGCYTCSFVCPVKAISFKFKVKSGILRVVRETGYGFPVVSSEIVPGRPNSGKLVTEVKNIAKKIMRGNGILLIDAAAGIGCQVISSLAGANLAILVAEPTPASYSDLKRIHKLAKHFGIPSTLIVNKYDLDREYLTKILDYASKENIQVLGLIPYDDAVPKALTQMAPLIKLYPNSKASKALIKIAEKLDSILSKWDEWRLEHIPSKIEPFKPIIIKPGEESF